MPTYIRPAKVVVSEGGGGGGKRLLVLAVSVVAILIRKPVEHAADVAAEIAVYTVASVAVLAAVAGMAYAAVRLHRRRVRNRQAVLGYTLAPQALTGPLRHAIEAPS